MVDSLWSDSEWYSSSGDSTDSRGPVIELDKRPENLFLVHRTSRYRYIDEPPCDGAFLVSVVRVDRRSVDDPKKIPANHGTDGDWYELGTNHRIVDGMICRDMDREVVWAVYCKDVWEFSKSVACSVIVSPVSLWRNDFPELEIYDDYRE